MYILSLQSYISYSYIAHRTHVSYNVRHTSQTYVQCRNPFFVRLEYQSSVILFAVHIWLPMFFYKSRDHINSMTHTPRAYILIFRRTYLALVRLHNNVYGAVSRDSILHVYMQYGLKNNFYVVKLYRTNLPLWTRGYRAYTVQRTVFTHNVHCTLYNVHCILYNVHIYYTI